MKPTNKTALGRLRIVQRCLDEEIWPRLEDLPPARSDKQRAARRVLTNFVAMLIEGNKSFLEGK